MDRRRFLKTSLAASAASVLFRPLATPARLFGNSPKRILVLGGTTFLGPAVVEAGVVAGHKVTLFNRGITNPGLFPALEKLRGFRSADRGDENFAALGQRRWVELSAQDEARALRVWRDARPGA